MLSRDSDSAAAAVFDLRPRLLKERPAAAIQIVDNAPHLRVHSESLAGNEQPHRKALLIGIGAIQRAENLVRFAVPGAILKGFAQVIAQLADGLLHRNFAILIRPFDISQRNHLLERGTCGYRIEARVRRMAPIGSRNLVPARNEGGGRPLRKGLR